MRMPFTCNSITLLKYRGDRSNTKIEQMQKSDALQSLINVCESNSHISKSNALKNGFLFCLVWMEGFKL